MSPKQHPRLEKFFKKLKTVFLTAQPARPAVFSAALRVAKHEQLELDLGVGTQGIRRPQRK